MAAFSRVFSVKSNARRAARKAGCNPDSVVACSGGYHYPAAKEGRTPSAKVNEKKPVTREAQSGAQLQKVYEMITARGGATIPEILKATGWLPHTARARISGIVAKHNLTIERERFMGVTTYKATATQRK